MITSDKNYIELSYCSIIDLYFIFIKKKKKKKYIQWNMSKATPHLCFMISSFILDTIKKKQS